MYQYFRETCPGWVVAVAMTVGFTASPAAAQGAASAAAETLQRARLLYNQGQFQAAIDVAKQARTQSGTGDLAALLQGRAGLEQFRQTASAGELIGAREALRSVNANVLNARDRIDLVIGLAEALFLDGSFRAAADLFGSALGATATLDAATRDQLLDWWATAVDRHAQSRHVAERLTLYTQLADEMTKQLRSDPSSSAASYWLVMAIRNTGDFDRAWDAAVSGWVRAQLNRARATSLRPDLDKLVTTALIPERARHLAAVTADPDAERHTIGLTAEWERVKASWQP